MPLAMAAVTTEVTEQRYANLPGHSATDARVKWCNDLDGVEASLAVTNVFDNDYVVSKFEGIDVMGGLAGQVGQPRERMLALKKQF